jgi:hypothetical protein
MIRSYYWFILHIDFIVLIVVLTYKMYIAYMNKTQFCFLFALVPRHTQCWPSSLPRSCSRPRPRSHDLVWPKSLVPTRTHNSSHSPCRSPVPFGFSSRLDDWQVHQWHLCGLLSNCDPHAFNAYGIHMPHWLPLVWGLCCHKLALVGSVLVGMSLFLDTRYFHMWEAMW